MFNCEICGGHPKDGVTVHRVNPTGEEGRFRCQAHLETAIPADLRRLVDIIERAGRAEASPRD